MSFSIANKDTLNTVPIVDKQIIFSVDEQTMYVDLANADGEVVRSPYLADLPGRVSELEEVAARLAEI
jgi:hypothetical protein